MENENVSMRSAVDNTILASKLLGAVILIVGVMASGWAQFIGPGFWRVMQDNLGITDLAERVTMLEETSPPPPVVEWNRGLAGQIGECLSNDVCSYTLTGLRTEYGETCGRPDSFEVEFVSTRPGSRVITTSYHSSFRGIELNSRERTFQVPLVIPSVSDGAYLWRSKATYPNCPGAREPIPRYSPWWSVTIGPQP